MGACLTLITLALVTLAVLSGCGEPLADGRYRGDALYEVSGPLLLADFDQLIALAECQAEADTCAEEAYAACEREEIAEEDDCSPAETCFAELEHCLVGEGADVDVFTSDITLGVSLVWSDPDGDGGLVEQASTIDPGLPARYRLTVFQPPPDAVLHRTDAGDYAVGVLVAFEDIDGDGRIQTAFESVLGGSAELALLYTPGGVAHPELGSFAPGFHRVVPIDDWCENREGLRFEAPDESASPITFGRLDELAPALLPDLDCEDGLSEWGLCPDDADVERCDERRPPLYCAFCDQDGDDEVVEADDDEDGALDPDE